MEPSVRAGVLSVPNGSIEERLSAARGGLPPELAEAIKVLARAHQSLVWTRQRQVNQLRSTLREFYPGALTALAGDLASHEPAASRGWRRRPSGGGGSSLARPFTGMRGGPDALTTNMVDDHISPEFPYEGHFREILDSFMHYLDEGEGRPILLLHGNPTWSYLWRNVIPHLTPKGRVIAPDLIGMGRSGKPDIEYRFVDHVRYLDAFIEGLGLGDVALVVHDWGSLLGFHYAQRHEANVRAIAFMEANVLPRYSWDEFEGDARQLFEQFRTPGIGWNLIVNQNAFIERVLPDGVIRGLTEREMEFYREPFRDPATRKPVWRWPNELPVAGDPPDVFTVNEAYAEWLQRTDMPKLMLTVEPGAIITPQVAVWCRSHLPSLTEAFLGPGYHFVQEDYPHTIGRAIAEWLDRA